MGVFDKDPRTAEGFPGTLGKICTNRRDPVATASWVELSCDSGYLTRRFLRVIKWGYQYLSICEVRHGAVEGIDKRFKVTRKLS